MARPLSGSGRFFSYVSLHLSAVVCAINPEWWRAADVPKAATMAKQRGLSVGMAGAQLAAPATAGQAHPA